LYSSTQKNPQLLIGFAENFWADGAFNSKLPGNGFFKKETGSDDLSATESTVCAFREAENVKKIAAKAQKLFQFLVRI
jgi:hypothetical protein